MFTNFIKIAVRNFTKHKLYTVINVSGLAIGFFACLMILLWIQYELSYDSFHSKADRIYRIEREILRDNLYSRWPITGGMYKQALIDDIPEIENAVRFWRKEFSIKDHNNLVHRQQVYAVDNSIFEIFDFCLEAGDMRTALTKPMTVVLTREKAVTYFGTDQVLGKTLFIEWDGKPVGFEVTGILRELPANAHMHFDMLISISSYPKESFNQWRSNYLYTYVLVNKNTSREDLENKLKTFVEKRLEPYYGDLLVGQLGIHDVLKMHLFPLRDIHLHPSENWEIEAGGNIVSVYIFSSIAVLILVVACINFMNLSTAGAGRRIKEISLRKTLGADKAQLRYQFFMESLLLSAVSILIAIDLAALFTPVFNRIFNENLSSSILSQGQNILILTVITLVVGIIAGFYPAFYLTKFNPTDVLKGTIYTGTGKSVFRRNMMIIQFVISITLLTAMFTIYKQMDFIKTRSPGYDKENVVIIPIRSSRVTQNYNAFRNALLLNSRVISVCASADVPSDRIYGNTGFTDSEDHTNFASLINIFTDYDFMDTYKMEVVAGRSFSREFSSDTNWTMMLNESAVKKFGWTNRQAVGKKLVHRDNIISPIVGVVKNFNFKSVHTEIEPLAILLSTSYISAVSVRIAPGNFDETRRYIERTWHRIFSGENFDFSFLDERLNRLYENDLKTQNIFFLFSFLSLFVACLGLFGLSVFIASERTKEIGIRKVLGASTEKIILLLSKEFITWILIANIAAWPVAWFMMNRWLQNFAYRIDISWWMFLLAGGLALIIALLTVSVQTIRSALSNPVKALRYE